MPAWTDKMDDILMREAKAGASAMQIATAIANETGHVISRSGVISRSHRIKIQIGVSRWSKAGRPKASSPPKVAAPKPARPHHPGRIAIAPPKLPSAPPKPKLPPPRPAEIVPIGVTIDGLTLTTCRAPIWGSVTPPVDQALYCGAATLPGCPYCAGHRYRFTERPAPKAAKEAA